MNYSALKFGEAGIDVLKSLPPLVVALIPGQQRSLDKLKAMRVHLSNEVADLINEYGPTLYDNFDEWRILVPSASAPPSTGTPGIWRRKTNTGAVDAQGSLLIHPMTWIDERLFGWSRSSGRGTSAWAGGSHSEMPSRVATPDVSDDEDHGDYEHVLGYIPSHGDESHSLGSKSRSRQSSYADLTKLRMTSLAVPGQRGPVSSSVAPSTQSTDLPSRQGRERKNSLSDTIPVERIAKVDRRDSFGKATQDLNAEVDREKS